MIFIYTPLDIYLHNPVDFIVGWKFLLPPLLLVFLIFFILLSALFFIIWRFKLTAGIVIHAFLFASIIFARFGLNLFSASYIYMLIFTVLAAVLWTLLINKCNADALDISVLLVWGLIIAAYLQTLFLNGNMIEIRGVQTTYSDRSLYNILNMLLWVVVILIPPCIYVLLLMKKKIFRFEKALVLSVIAFALMQATGLVTAAMSADLPKGYDEGDLRYKSYENLTRFNKDKNIMVFVLDRLDVEYMKDTLEEYPHLYEKLDGFTHFEDNMTEYMDTFPSVTAFLTQYYYEQGQSLGEYWEKAWSLHGYIDTLIDNGFYTNLYLDYTSTYDDLEQIEERTNNLQELKRLDVNPGGFVDITTRLSLGRSAPYLMKNLFLANVGPNFGNGFFVFPKWAQDLVIGMHSDLKFLSYIKQNEFSADVEESTFTVKHFNCSHVHGHRDNPASYGYHFDDESGTIKLGGNTIDSTRAFFEILDTYFNYMKELGVYDNTMIIMLADHGADRVIREGDPSFERLAKRTGSLLIKPFGSTGRLQIDTKTELSNKYLGASVLEAAGLPDLKTGLSYFDLINGAEPPVRIMYGTEQWILPWAEQGSSAVLNIYGIYEVSGDANKDENWALIPIN